MSSIRDLPSNSCVTLGEALNLSEPHEIVENIPHALQKAWHVVESRNYCYSFIKWLVISAHKIS